MGFFNKKKTPPPQPEEKQVLETAIEGTKLHVNPPPNVRLERMEARLKRVNLSLASGKWKVGSSREMEFQTIKRRLEAQIAIQKGEI